MRCYTTDSLANKLDQCKRTFNKHCIKFQTKKKVEYLCKTDRRLVLHRVFLNEKEKSAEKLDKDSKLKTEAENDKSDKDSEEKTETEKSKSDKDSEEKIEREKSKSDKDN